MEDEDDRFNLDMCGDEHLDEKEGSHQIARIDRGLGRKAMTWLCAEIERELRELGVEPPPEEPSA